jgi:cysteinyl-tRNA synthetase
MENFEPINPPYVGMYVCGPTVYSDSHLGHAKSYVSFDLVLRYLRYLKYNVKYIQNITDVGHLTDDADEGEDKILKKARLERVDPMAIAESYTRSYFEDMDALNVIRPNISPRATGHIIEQIEMIKDLISKNYAYEVNGNVYFDVRKFDDYGKLSGRLLEDSQSGTRVETSGDKRNPEDFALWKKADESHLMRWISPWGEGYPGWHIECSAMSMKYIGETLDIHGGGMENKFPHHECEIAQSEAHTGKQFVKYWMHNNMVTRDGVKMGKSLGNFITLKEAMETHGALTVRMFVLNSHYRSTLDYSEHALESAKKGLKRLQNAYNEIDFRVNFHSKEGGKALPFDYKKFETEFFVALDDDFSTPKAFVALFDLVKEINLLSAKQYDKKVLTELHNFMKVALDEILGLLESRNQSNDLMPCINGLMDFIFELRNKAREEKNYELSDQIRDQLTKTGIEVRDTPEGSKWQVTG